MEVIEALSEDNVSETEEDLQRKRGDNVAQALVSDAESGPREEYNLDINNFREYGGSNISGAEVREQVRGEGTGTALEQRRSDAQWMPQIAANMAGHLLTGAVLNVGETVGHVLDIEANTRGLKNAINKVSSIVTGSEYEADSDFEPGNAFTRLMKEWERESEEAMPLYLEDASDTADFSDMQAWMKHGSELGESLAGFAATGMGVGGLLGKGATGIARLANMGARGHKWMQAAANTATAYELTATEGLMEASQVYSDTYRLAMEEGLKKGMTGDEADEYAKQMSANSAATTFRMNLPNMALNLTGVRAMFRSPNMAKQFKKFGISRNGRGLKQWSEDLASNENTRGFLREHLKSLASESGQESLEEFVNAASTFEGMLETEQALGRRGEMTYGEKLTELLGSSDTYMSMALGAIGGAAQQSIMSHTPVQKVQNEEGDGYTRTSDYAKRKQLYLDKQMKMRRAMADRIDQFRADEKAMDEASSENGDRYDFINAQNRMFTTTSLENIMKGTEQQMISTYEEVANMSEEEAANKGYSDNYREMAEEKIKDIKQLSDDYRDHQRRYSYSQEEDLAGLGEEVFRHHLDRHNAKRIRDRLERERNETKERIRQNQENRSTTRTEDEWLMEDAKLKGLEQTAKSIRDDVDSVEEIFENGTKAQRDNLKREYGIPKRRNRTQTKEAIKRKQEQAEQKATKKDVELSEEAARIREEDNLTEEEFEQKFNSDLKQNSKDEIDLAKAEAYLEKANNSLENKQEAYDRITSNKGRKDFVEGVKQESDRKRKEAEDRQIDDIKKARSVSALRSVSTDPDSLTDRVKNEYRKKEDELGIKRTKEKKDAKERRKKEAENIGEIPDIEGDADEPDNIRVEETSDPEENVTPDDPAEPEEGETPPDPNPPTRPRSAPDPTSDFRIRETQSINSLDRLDEFEEMMERSTLAEPIENPNSDQVSAREKSRRERYQSVKDAISQRREELQKIEQAENEAINTATRNDTPAQSASNSKDQPDEVSTSDDAQATPNGNEKSGDGVPLIRGAKTTQAGSTVVNMPFESQTVQLSNGQIAYTNDSNTRQEDFNNRVDSPDFVQEGDTVVIEVDESQLDNYDDSPEDIPLVVKLEQGEDGRITIGYIRRTEWVANEENLAGTQEEKELQLQINRDLRQKLYDRLVNGQESRVETTITGKSPGHLSKSYARDETGQVIFEDGEPLVEFNVVSDVVSVMDDMELFVYRNGQRETGLNQPTTRDLINNDEDTDLSSKDGILGAIIPTGNGKFFAATLWVPTLTDTQVDTVYNIITATNEDMDNIAEARADAENFIDFNRNTEAVKSELIRELVQSRTINQEDAKNELSDLTHPMMAANENGMIQVYDPERGKIYSLFDSDADNDNTGTYEKIAFPSNRERVKELLSEIRFNADLSRFNSNAAFTNLSINNDGQVDTREYSSYHEYLLDNVETYLNGRDTYTDREGNQHSLFFEKPAIQFDTNIEERQVGNEPVRSQIGTPDPSDNNSGSAVSGEIADSVEEEDSTQEEEAKAKKKSRDKKRKAKFGGLASMGNGSIPENIYSATSDSEPATDEEVRQAEDNYEYTCKT